MMERIVLERNVVRRHSVIELAEHWVLAVSGFLLIFSGFGELPMYKRYMVTEIPGLGWSGDFFVNLKIHYLAGILFVSVMVFHALYHGVLGHQGLLPKRGDVGSSMKVIATLFGFGEEPKSGKYLPEQRLAYAYLGGVGLLLVLTGIGKVMKNLPGVSFPPALVTSLTLVHTFGTIFFLIGVVAHLAALVLKVNRPLARSIFSGDVDLGYVRERHTVWYDELVKKAEDRGRKVKDKETGPGAPEEGTKEILPRPDLGAVLEEKEEKEMVLTLKVKGMSCQHCVASIKKVLGSIDGIQNVDVDLQQGEVRFESRKAVESAKLVKAIEDAGYHVES